MASPTGKAHTFYSLRHTAICMRIVNSEGRVNTFNLAHMNMILQGILDTDPAARRPHDQKIVLLNSDEVLGNMETKV